MHTHTEFNIAFKGQNLVFKAPHRDFGITPPWAMPFEANEKGVDIILHHLNKEITRAVKKELLSFTVRTYTAPIRVSGSVQVGHYFIDSFGNIVVNEQEASGNAWDSDGDRAQILCFGTLGKCPAAIVKFPITKTVKWFKPQETLSETFKSLPTKALDLDDRHEKVDYELACKTVIKKRTDPQVGLKTVHVDKRDIRRANSLSDPKDRRSLIGQDPFRFELIEGGMKAVRGSSVTASAFNDFGRNRYKLTDGGLWLSGQSLDLSELINSSKIDELMGELQQKYWNLETSSEVKPVKQKFNWSPDVSKPKPREHTLFDDLVRLGMIQTLELGHLIPGCNLTLVWVADRHGNPVALTSQKKDGLSTVNYFYLVPPQVKVEYVFMDAHGYKVDSSLVDKVNGKWVAFQEEVGYFPVTLQECNVILVNSYQVVKESFDQLWYKKTKKWSDIENPDNARYVSRILSALEEQCSRCGIHCLGSEFFEGQVSVKGKTLNQTSIDVGKTCVGIDFGSTNPEKIWEASKQIMMLFQGTGLKPNVMGLDRGKARPNQLMTLSKAERNHVPLYAPLGCNPVRSAEMKKQLANSKRLPNCYLVIVDGNTESQMFATPSGVDKQHLEGGVFMPKVVLPELSDEYEEVLVRSVTGQEKALNLSSARKTAEVGKIIHGAGIKNCLAPMDQATFKHEGQTLNVDFMMNYKEFIKKGCLKAMIDAFGLSKELQRIYLADGTIIMGVVLKLTLYRTLNGSENVAPGWRDSRFSGMAGIMTGSALENNAEGVEHFLQNGLTPNVVARDYIKDLLSYQENLLRFKRVLSGKGMLV